eukprot:UN04076
MQQQKKFIKLHHVKWFQNMSALHNINVKFKIVQEYKRCKILQIIKVKNLNLLNLKKIVFHIKKIEVVITNKQKTNSKKQSQNIHSPLFCYIFFIY